MKRGEALGIGAVASKLMDQINEGNTTAMIFYLKSRAGWRESSEIRVEANTPGEGMAAVYATMREANSNPEGKAACSRRHAPAMGRNRVNGQERIRT